MSFKFSELSQKLNYYLLDTPLLTTEEYRMELATLIEVFRKVVTPTFVRKGNIIELQDPFPECPDSYRVRLSQLALARLERTIDLEVYLKKVEEARNEFK